MNPKDDSGPAFPVPGLSGLPNDQFLYPLHGISERKYYAAKIVKVLLANALLERDPGKRGNAILESVESSFFIADLMVKEGEK